MKRWNGWGDDSVVYPIPTSARRFIESLIGSGQPPYDASLSEALARVPDSHLPDHPLVTTDPLPRLQHARGQSFPNWVELHSGQIKTYPDGVAYPQTTNDVISLIQYASQAGISVIPYGGGTSVVGHIDPLIEGSPALTIDLSRMNSLISLDGYSLLATFAAGVSGPDLEAQLRAKGYTLGHYPQSFEYSTLGGWIATRSSGQQSLRYGRIERMFAGGIIVTPMGKMEMPAFPASAAGPDLREMVLGSEGRFGILTEACIRISPIPEREEFHAIFFPDFMHGIQAAREILASNIPLCMLRLSTANETTTTLALAGHENLIRAMERLLALRGMVDQKCMLILGFSGLSGLVRDMRREALHITSRWSGVHMGRTLGEQWHKNRFRTPYLRNTLWEMGFGVDTLETATSWVNTSKMVDQIEAALRDALSAFDERLHVFTHLSHVYPSGSSVYTTYLFRLDVDPEVNLNRWDAMKKAASQAVVANGGTISHQHGVGVDHLPYLAIEKGSLGMSAISSLCRQFDPQGIMNPGKLVATL
jgi:alkyldihydroxyacetonephosphate synthase